MRTPTLYLDTSVIGGYYDEEFTFKVMPWLRKVREENAKETEGMTPEERIAHTHKRAKWFYDSVNSHSPMSALHENKAVYHAVKNGK